MAVLAKPTTVQLPTYLMVVKLVFYTTIHVTYIDIKLRPRDLWGPTVLEWLDDPRPTHLVGMCVRMRRWRWPASCSSAKAI